LAGKLPQQQENAAALYELALANADGGEEQILAKKNV